MSTIPTNVEAIRRQQQLSIAASHAQIEIGAPGDAPLPLDELAGLTADHPGVRETRLSGLTAIVYKLHAQGRDWAVKCARPECLVKNVDGQTSFLNELQRRAELAALRALPGGSQRWAGLVRTVWASRRHAVIVSPWIAGEPVRAWSERSLCQLFSLGRELVRAGFFEWDFCPGNVLDDGKQLWLFDFGYMYRFDPLQHFNSAGTGNSVPQCHLAERIETRHVFGWLLEVEQTDGIEAALRAFRLEKAIALDTYLQLRAELQGDGASARVLGWLGAIIERWRGALAGDLLGLYLQEGWRSHTLDLEDDLHGQTCTPGTLRRADWLLRALRDSWGSLAEQSAFSGRDAGRTASDLTAHYEEKRRLAATLQVAPAKA
ncbi:MAG: hypothetical protein H7Y33_15290 [Cytophagales bacterium]|nr:hypothetical protein [Rhizobacter sp.]